MLKRLNIITVVIAVLLVPALLFAADRFAPAEATIGADNTIIVPLDIANQDDLMAMDIPLPSGRFAKVNLVCKFSGLLHQSGKNAKWVTVAGEPCAERFTNLV